MCSYTAFIDCNDTNIKEYNYIKNTGIPVFFSSSCYEIIKMFTYNFGE